MELLTSKEFKLCVIPGSKLVAKKVEGGYILLLPNTSIIGDVVLCTQCNLLEPKKFVQIQTLVKYAKKFGAKTVTVELE